MSIEFIATTPSSHVHVGPNVPIGGMSNSMQSALINTKTVLFLISSIIQLYMYIGIFCNCIKIPEEEDEDAVSRNEAYLFCYGNKSYELTHQQHMMSRSNALDVSISPASVTNPIPRSDSDDINDINFNSVNLVGSSTRSEPPIDNRNVLTLAYIENAYIIFWISKDLFWSWGTGDLTKGQDLAIMYEALAMSFGCLSIFIYILTAYLYRRNILRLFDCITTIFWISANFVWMCGEFFLRYDNLTYDDENEGNDSSTRIVSAILFTLGLLIQLVIIFIMLYYNYVFQQAAQKPSSSIVSSSVEMTTVKSPFNYERLFVNTIPQQQQKQHQLGGLMDDDEEIIVF
jgi:hypothetical protein